MKLYVVGTLVALMMMAAPVSADDETTVVDVGGVAYVTDYGGDMPGVRAESNGCEGMQAHDGDDGCDEADMIVL